MTSETTSEFVATVNSPSAGPGERLRLGREARGLTVAEAADALAVIPAIVTAMETNAFGAFDAPVYARGFLRKYATMLGLSAEDVLAEYEAQASGPTLSTLIPPMSAMPAAAVIPRLRLPALFFGLVFIVAGSYWWWLSRPAAPVVAPLVKAAPAAADSVSASPPTASPVASVAPAEENDVPAEGPPANATPDASVAAAASPVVAPLARPVAASDVATSPAATPSATVAQFVLHGIRDCWVEVRSPAGERVFYDLVKAGQTRPVSGSGPWRVFLGVVDGIRLTVGDHDVRIPAERRSGTTARLVVTADGTVQ